MPTALYQMNDADSPPTTPYLWNGTYWSSNVDGIKASYLNFVNGVPSAVGIQSTGRAFGRSVRCIKDN